MYMLKLIFFEKWIFMGSRQTIITSFFLKSLDSFNTKSIFSKDKTNAS